MISLSKHRLHLSHRFSPSIYNQHPSRSCASSYVTSSLLWARHHDLDARLLRVASHPIIKNSAWTPKKGGCEKRLWKNIRLDSRRQFLSTIAKEIGSRAAKCEYLCRQVQMSPLAFIQPLFKE